MSEPGRDDPCPCGSGKKFKRCCARARRDPVEAAAEIHEWDERVVSQILRFAQAEAEPALAEAIRQLPYGKEDAKSHAQIAVPFLLHEMRVGGRTLVERYLEHEGTRLEGRRLAWLEANRPAWFSVWEVQEVEAERSIDLLDLLTGERRRVTERSGGRGLLPRHALLARVVDHAGLSLIVGSHPRPLDAGAAAEVVDEARRALDAPAGNVPPSRLRAPFSSTLLGLWEETVARVDARPPPTLQNTDGDPLVWTEEVLEFEASDHDAVVAAIAALDDVDPEEDVDPAEEEESLVFRWGRAGGPMGPESRTSLGTVEVSAASVKLTTNSERRANRLRAMLERACPGLLRRGNRTCKDVQDFMASSMGRTREEPPMTPSVPPEIAASIVREFKERHYATWPDVALPALDGLTPRAAAAAGPAPRARLDVLLKELESGEARDPPAARYDVRRLRRTLGL